MIWGIWYPIAMSCNDIAVIAKIFSKSQPEIIKGSDFNFSTQLVLKDDTCCPASIETFQGATGFFENDDGTVLASTGTLISADLATLRFDLSAEETALLKSGDESSFEMSVEDDAGLRFFQFDGKLVIKDRLF